MAVETLRPHLDNKTFFLYKGAYPELGYYPNMIKCLYLRLALEYLQTLRQSSISSDKVNKKLGNILIINEKTSILGNISLKMKESTRKVWLFRIFGVSLHRQFPPRFPFEQRTRVGLLLFNLR